MRKLIFLLAIALPAAAQVTVVNTWEGADGDVSGTYRDHGDNCVAVSPTHVLQITGQTISAWDKSGNVVSGYPKTMATFVSGFSYSQINDPRCSYNPHSGRFLVVIGVLTGPALIVSSGSDLSTATWKSVLVAATGQGGDSTPHVGWNKWWTVVTHIDLTNTNFSLAYAIPNADTQWVGAGTIDLSHMATSGQIDFESVAATDRSTSTLVSDPLIISARGTPAQSCSNCNITLHTRTVTGSSSTAPSISGLTNIGPTGMLYNTPVSSPNQPGGSIQPIKGTESHRLEKLVQAGTHVYGVINTGPGSGDSHNGWVVFDINPNTLTLTSSKRMFGGANDTYLFGSQELDGSGNLVICGTLYSGTVYGSVECWMSTDHAVTFTGPTMVYAGTVAYTGGTGTGPAGWGTYSQTIRDPSDSSKIWTTQQYGGSATNNVWTTRIAQVSTGIAAPTAATKFVISQ